MVMMMMSFVGLLSTVTCVQVKEQIPKNLD
jgi:hypothetical protein